MHQKLNDIVEFRAFSGQLDESVKILRSTISAVERRYGTSSIELGHELIKLERILRAKEIK